MRFKVCQHLNKDQNLYYIDTITQLWYVSNMKVNKRDSIWFFIVMSILLVLILMHSGMGGPNEIF